MIAVPILIHNPLSLSEPISWCSAANRAITKTFYNHGAILVFDDENFYNNGIGWHVIEAVGHGVHIVDIDYYNSYSRNRIVSFVDVEDLGYKCNFQFLKEQIGKKYQYSIWWSYPLMEISNTFFGKESEFSLKLSNVNNPDRWYCFELVNTAFNLGLGSTEVGSTFEIDYAGKIEHLNMLSFSNNLYVNKIKFNKNEN